MWPFLLVFWLFSDWDQAQADLQEPRSSGRLHTSFARELFFTAGLSLPQRERHFACCTNTLWDLWGFKTEKLWGSKAHFQKTLWFWSLIYHDLIIFGVLGTSKPADLIISKWILSMSAVSWKQYSKDYSWRFSCLKCPCQYWSLILRMFNMEINFLKNCWLTQFVTPLACLATSGKKTTLVAKLFALPSQPPQVNCLHEESLGELNHLKNDEENLKWENITW